MKKITKHSLINASATALYIIIVSTFIYSLSNFAPDEKKTILIPIAMLMLLVFSVALVGTLIFGKPILWFLEGKKKEALKLLVYTLAILLILVILAFALLLIFL